MFQYKTRGNSSPQGKQRVYFTCHPKDFDTYFEKISDQILEHENCAVWYSYPEEAYQDIETDLGQMNLFVIPVTTKLLTTSNRTMDIDLPFALEKHIPVLPLMQENGLDELFCKKFGDLQYLNENAKDDTAIPYKEKLKRYLSSVLVGDELAAKVRAAFDAYIFLSYRKKDRKYAHELMRLIHKNDFCRDIAIWYDEFLTPGEDFKDSINKMLDECKLFTLLVTPSVLEQVNGVPNFVMREEFPKARDNKMKILPAEMMSTDKNELYSKFEGLPDCIDARNGNVLTQSLLDHLSGIAKMENDNDPQHNFFIGLAYLNGIDVETDTDRAVSLITSSADAGIVEALQKLVSMYQNGEGVQRDYLRAIEWQRKLVEQCKNAYRSSGSVADGENLLSELWDLGDYLYDIRDLSGAESSYLDMEKYAKERPDVFRRDLSVSYGKLGDIRISRGDLAGAEEYYVKSLEFFEALAKETGTVLSRRDLSISYERLGNIHRGACGDLAGAEEYYKKSFELFEALAKETGTVEARRDLSVSYNELGDISKALGDLAGAEEYYVKALELSEALAKETGTVEARRDLSVSYEKLGDISKALGDLAGAEEYYKKSFEFFEALAKETGTVEARRDLSLSYNKLGDIRKARCDLAAAGIYYRKALKLSEALAKETGTVEARLSLSISYNKLGDIRKSHCDIAGAEEYYKKSFDLFESFAKETGTVEARRELSVIYNQRGEICESREDLTGAEEYYTKCLELCKTLAKETGTVEDCRDLSISYEKLGDIRRARGDIAKAEEYYTKCLELREELAKKTGTVESYDDFASSCVKCAMIKDEPDVDLLWQAFQISDALAKQCPDVPKYQQRRDSLYNIFYGDQ